MATKSIGATGRDYATLGAWISYVNGLGTLSAPEIGEMYNDGEFAGATSMEITGITTDPTNNITLRPATGQGFKDHPNARSNPLFYDYTKGVGVNLGSTHGAFRVNVPNVIIDGIQVKRSALGYDTAVLSVNSGPAANTVIFRNCILGKEYSGTGSAIQIRRQIIRNCLIYDTSNSNNILLQFGSGYSGGSALNCTVVRANASANGTGIRADYAARAINNCAVFNCTTAFGTASGGSFTGNYNGTDAASGAPGANSQHNLTFANCFESTTTDFRLKTGSPLIDAGSTDATNAPNDITGFARGSGTSGDIGAWEYDNGSGGGGGGGPLLGQACL